MAIPPEQREVAAFLTQCAGRPAIETHISAVFAGTSQVWKLKKAVKLPFLDFTTLQARHHFLRRELALNQPSAPDIYQDIAAIERTKSGALTFTTERDS